MESRQVPVRNWSCSQHDYPQRHTDCDCSHCPLEEGEWLCDECAASEWVDAVNEDGSPKMREMGPWEALLFDMPPVRLFPGDSPFSDMLKGSE